MCAKCKLRVESLENHTWGRKSLKGMRNRLLKIRTFITRHYIILTSLLYRVRTLTSHDTEESENSPESPHLGEIKRMRKQCTRRFSFFLRAPGTRLVMYVTFQYLTVSCVPATDRVCDISVPDSFMYLLQVMYVTFQYLTVSCIPATGHVCDISIPDSFMYTCYRSCM